MKSAPPGGHSDRLAFTLTEVIVAIAVTGIMALLLFVAAKSVSISVDNVKCINHLKASGHAMIRYFQDHNGQFLPNKNWFQYPSTRTGTNRGMREYFDVGSDQIDIMAEEFKRDTMLTCPAVKRLNPSYYPYPLNRGFGINIYLVQSTEGSPKITSRVPNISAMWTLTDTAINGALLGSINEKTAWSGSKTYLSLPHHERQNVIFLDGHIESLDLDGFRYPAKPREFWGNLALE